MAPRTESPRLSTLNPEAIAIDAVRAAAAYESSLTSLLNGRHRRLAADALLRTPLAAAVVAVVQYAQTGTPHSWDRTDNLFSSVTTVATALWSSAIDLYGGARRWASPFTGEADVTTPIGLAIVAALARHKIVNGPRVTAQELGALAGLSAHHVRLLGRAGELAVEDGHVSAKAAEVFLALRDVPGFQGR